MKFESVSRKFDNTLMWDAYNGRLLKYRCQITPWDAPRRDGLTTVRRTISVDAGFVPPKRRGIIAAKQFWIISDFPAHDTWNGNVHRAGYIIQHAAPVEVFDTETLLASDGIGRDTLASRVWVKDVKDISQESEMQSQYLIYFAVGEDIAESDFVMVSGRLHIVRNLYESAAGFLVAECNELEEDCIVGVSLVSTGRYNPVTEAYEDALGADFPAVRMHWKDDYANHLPSFIKEEVGDRRLRLSREHAPLVKMDSKLDFDGHRWAVTGLDSRKDGAVSVSVRRV